jgi:hypothetical protein
MSPTRRDPDGTRHVGPSWESLIERQIREAMADGRFDALPHQGVPLPVEDDAAAGDRALAHRMLRDAGFAPPWIEADKDARAGLARVEALHDQAARTGPGGRDRLRRALGDAVADTNRAIERVNAEAPTDRQHRRPLDLTVELDRLERGFAVEGR